MKWNVVRGDFRGEQRCADDHQQDAVQAGAHDEQGRPEQGRRRGEYITMELPK